jgi:hypothetical protein
MATTQSTEDSGHSLQPVKEANPNERRLLDEFVILPINKYRIVTEAPTEPFRLTNIDVMSLVINRMIGMLPHRFWRLPTLS